MLEATSNLIQSLSEEPLAPDVLPLYQGDLGDQVLQGVFDIGGILPFYLLQRPVALYDLIEGCIARLQLLTVSQLLQLLFYSLIYYAMYLSS